MVKEITALMIVEVAGRPKEYLKEALEKHISQLNNIKDAKLVSMKIAEPKMIDEEKDMYSCFAEVEVCVIGLQKLLDLVFDFMPSSVEIVDPVDLEINCQETTMFLNDLSGRLHKYDEVAKLAQLRIHQLSQALQQARPTPQQSSVVQPAQITYGDKEEKKTVQKQIKKITKKKK
jgi:hypothetical protein